MRRENSYYHLLAYTLVYFFFNGFLLPEGLLYTTLLTPVMLYFLYKNKNISPSPAWILLLLIPVPFQLFIGVDMQSYFVSSMLVLSAAIFLYSVAVVLRKYGPGIPDLFKSVLVVNTLFTGIALLIFPFTPIRDWLWYSVPVSAGVETIPRLKLFTYEASYYALIMAPVFLFYLFRVMFGKEKHSLIVAMACIVPLVLSLSFGVIGALFIALLITMIFYWKRLPLLFRRVCIYSGMLVIAAIVVTVITWWNNPVFLRIENIVQGKDTSAMGRLFYSFMFARELAAGHSWLFGVGPGQIKILAHDLIVNHYHYHGTVAETVRIPNGTAEMLATYGIYGLALKISLELWFFFNKKVFTNLFSFTLFMFLFVYQFTGSFLVNVAELAAWALIFTTRFSEFDLLPRQRGKEAIS